MDIQHDPSPKGADRFSRYLVFARQQWAQLRGNAPLTLSEERLVSLTLPRFGGVLRCEK